MKRKKNWVISGIVITLFTGLALFIINQNSIKWYGIVLFEEENIEEINKIKSVIDREYHIIHNYKELPVLTFETKDNLAEVNEKFGKYGTIEDLTNIDYELNFFLYNF